MRRLLLALALTLAFATPAQAGPPWLTVEFRPNFPGFMLIRTLHHGDPLPLPLTGTAEGLVNGERRSVPLTFTLTEKPNGYTVNKTWGDEGVWVLNIAATGDHLGAGVVVGFDRNGEPAFTRFPRTAVGASRPASSREANAMLRALESSAPPAALGRSGWSEVVLRTALPLLILVGVVLGIAKLGGAIFERAKRRSAAKAVA
ncbi:MAG: hypothetical protein V4550_18700 [Gemmatimonadota bacterium]